MNPRPNKITLEFYVCEKGRGVLGRVVHWVNLIYILLSAIIISKVSQDETSPELTALATWGALALVIQVALSCRLMNIISYYEHRYR